MQTTSPEAVFHKDYTLRTSDFDRDRRLHPATVLDIFQSVAGGHAELLGVGFEPMLQQRLVWEIVRARYQVLREIPMHTTVSVTTWPLPPTRAGFQREYILRNEAGETAIIGSSDWVLMHSEKRCMVPKKENIYKLQGELCEERVFPERLRWIRDFQPDEGEYLVRPGFSDLDMNGHVNNIKYANFVMDAIHPAPGEAISAFQIDYHREVLQGEELRILTQRQQELILAKGVDPSGEASCFCSVELKKD